MKNPDSGTKLPTRIFCSQECRQKISETEFEVLENESTVYGGHFDLLEQAAQVLRKWCAFANEQGSFVEQMRAGKVEKLLTKFDKIIAESKVVIFEKAPTL